MFLIQLSNPPRRRSSSMSKKRPTLTLRHIVGTDKTSSATSKPNTSTPLRTAGATSKKDIDAKYSWSVDCESNKVPKRPIKKSPRSGSDEVKHNERVIFKVKRQGKNDGSRFEGEESSSGESLDEIESCSSEEVSNDFTVSEFKTTTKKQPFETKKPARAKIENKDDADADNKANAIAPTRSIRKRDSLSKDAKTLVKTDFSIICKNVDVVATFGKQIEQGKKKNPKVNIHKFQMCKPLYSVKDIKGNSSPENFFPAIKKDGTAVYVYKIKPQSSTDSVIYKTVDYNPLRTFFTGNYGLFPPSLKPQDNSFTYFDVDGNEINFVYWTDFFIKKREESTQSRKLKQQTQTKRSSGSSSEQEEEKKIPLTSGSKDKKQKKETASKSSRGKKEKSHILEVGEALVSNHQKKRKRDTCDDAPTNKRTKRENEGPSHKNVQKNTSRGKVPDDFPSSISSSGSGSGSESESRKASPKKKGQNEEKKHSKFVLELCDILLKAEKGSAVKKSSKTLKDWAVWFRYNDYEKLVPYLRQPPVFQEFVYTPALRDKECTRLELESIIREVRNGLNQSTSMRYQMFQSFVIMMLVLDSISPKDLPTSEEPYIFC